MLFIILIAWAVFVVIWLVGHKQPGGALVLSRVPNSWREVLRAHWPLLLGAHLLICTAVVFGTRQAANPLYDVGLEAPGRMNARIYSEWPIDFWIGPFVICVAFLAVIVLVTTLFSDPWAQWRGDIVLIAGVILAGGIVAFLAGRADVFPADGLQHHAVIMPGTEIQTISKPHQGLRLMREWQYGMFLDLFAVVLVITAGLLMVNWPGLRSDEPRLSRIALWGALSILLSPAGIPIATCILGFIAVIQIKRSGGKLYGLRLAALEALLLPWMLILALAWALMAALVIALSNLFFRRFLESRGGPSGDSMQVGPNIFVNSWFVFAIGAISLLPALAITFFAGRGLWRRIVGRLAHTEFSSK